MGIGSRILELRIDNGLTQEQLAEKLSVSRQSVSKWEMEQSLPEIDKVVMMSKLFSVGTDEILLEKEDVHKLRPQELHLGCVYLIVRDFEKAISFYEKLLSMEVSTRNCGNRFAEFFFDNKCLALMNEANLPGHHYVDGDYKFVLNFWVEDLRREYNRLKELNIGNMTEIAKVHEGYWYFNIYDVDGNVCEITGEYSEEEKMKKVCQSCGMIMVENDLGNNADGSKNVEYCKYCYADGHFIKDETMEEMVESCIPFLLKDSECKDEVEARQTLTEELSKLKRWKK